MFARLGPAPDTLDDLSRIESLVRQRFDVDDADIVLVSQDSGARPGFPAIETNVVFWKDETRYKFKLFTPLAEVTEADLPLVWLLPSLEDTGEDCC